MKRKRRPRSFCGLHSSLYCLIYWRVVLINLPVMLTSGSAFSKIISNFAGHRSCLAHSLQNSVRNRTYMDIWNRQSCRTDSKLFSELISSGSLSFPCARLPSVLFTEVLKTLEDNLLYETCMVKAIKNQNQTIPRLFQ